MTRQRHKNNGMESAPEMDMPAEKIYEQSVLKQKQRSMLVNDCDSKYHREQVVWGYFGLTFPKAHS